MDAAEPRQIDLNTAAIALEIKIRRMRDAQNAAQLQRLSAIVSQMARDAMEDCER